MACGECPVPMFTVGYTAGHEAPFPLNSDPRHGVGSPPARGGVPLWCTTSFPLADHSHGATTRTIRTEVPFPMTAPGRPPILSIDEAQVSEQIAILPGGQLAARIIDVKVSTLSSPIGQTVIVAANGQFPSGRWTNARLQQSFVYVVEPTDGIYDFDMVATPPGNHSTFQLSFLTAVTIWPIGNHPLKGVRIHSKTNVVTAMIGPASAAFAADTTPDYSSWVGKKLTRAGKDSTPGDIAETHLPKRCRVIGPHDLAETTTDHHKINVHIDGNDKIVAISTD